MSNQNRSLTFKVNFTNDELIDLRKFALKINVTMDQAFTYLAKSNLKRIKNVSIQECVLPR